MKRYEWEDALIEAQVDGRITDTALMVALKISKAINWAPTKYDRPGLYWSNDEACAKVGVARSTFYKMMKKLKRAGFVEQVKGNIVPALSPTETPRVIEESPTETSIEHEARPIEQKESPTETLESPSETPESPPETSLSLQGDTFSEDICSEDLLSEDICSGEDESDDSSHFEDCSLGIEERDSVQERAGPVELPPIHTRYEAALALAREKSGTRLPESVWRHIEHLVYSSSYLPDENRAYARVIRAMEAAELHAQYVGEWEEEVSELTEAV